MCTYSRLSNDLCLFRNAQFYHSYQHITNGTYVKDNNIKNKTNVAINKIEKTEFALEEIDIQTR